MFTQEVEDMLKKEGFSDFCVWRNASTDVYPTHTHNVIMAHVFVQGTAFVTMNGVEKEYGPGDRVDVPAYAEHAARFGPEGSTYVTGEKKV